MSRKQNITAIIYDKRGKVLSIGKNSYTKTHTLQHFHSHKVGLPEKCFLHAEIHAISLCRKLDRAYRIVVSRYNAAGQPVNAKPCPVCRSAINSTPIKIVEHT